MAKAMGKSTDGVAADKQPRLFVEALVELQEKCGVRNLKMSDYGISREDIPKLAANAFDTMGALFALDRYCLSMDDAIAILKRAYR
jgi:alcohol dehydrogenase